MDRRVASTAFVLAASLVVACSSADPGGPASDAQDSGARGDAASVDSGAASNDAAADTTQPDTGTTPGDAGGDAHDAAVRPECEWGGAPGKCMASAACSAITDHSPEPGTCATGLQCCIDTPDVGDNPPFPTGYKLMTQSQVTPAMTTWAVNILHDPVTYPMYATTTQMFGSLLVLAQVEWHPPDFQNSIVHRGVTLFEPM